MQVIVSQTLSRSFNINSDGNKSLVDMFKEQHWDISSLLNVLQEYLEYDLHHLDRPKRNVNVRCLLNQLASCKHWQLDEQEVIQE